MHEFGLCEGVIDAVAQRAAGRRVARVTVRAGALLHIKEGAFQQAFEHASAGTEAENASVELRILPVRARCRDCGQESESDDPIAVCPHCGSVDPDMEGGYELMLESIEYAAVANKVAAE